MDIKPILWIIIPCYNEEEVFPVTSPLFPEKTTELCDNYTDANYNIVWSVSVLENTIGNAIQP